VQRLGERRLRSIWRAEEVFAQQFTG